MNDDKTRKTSYSDAGVSIDRGNQLVQRIKSAANSTHNAGVMGNLGGFGALFDVSAFSYKDPVLVSGTDGVGTKIKLAIEMNIHNTIGIDLVAMCVNDLIVQGAQPLFFLDYFACSKLDVDIASTVIEGIAEGCRMAGCALVGGETAEMPGMYEHGDYDLAGFCVGAVERNRIIDGSQVKDGDILIALASSGPHSNGYSLIRKLLEDSGTDVNMPFENKTVGEYLLQPTRIYVKPVMQLISAVNVKAVAHITGGGLIENIPRVLPEGVDAIIDTRTWLIPPVFGWLQSTGNIDVEEMYRTFNCGAGLVICISGNEKDVAMECLTRSGETAWVIGHIESNNKKSPEVKFTAG